jgi:xylan 1,4-beta-xylosidase
MTNLQKRLSEVICIAALGGAVFAGPFAALAQTSGKTPHANAMSAGEIAAGLEAHDRALYIKTGWIRDPYITCGPDGLYYLTGTTPQDGEPREQTEPYNTGLGDGSIVGGQAHVWRSRDLAKWESLGAPFTLLDGVWPTGRPRRFRDVPQDQWHLWAPELHVVGDRWALVHTSPAPVQGANLSLTAGPELAGPWTNPMGADIGRRHDPSLFHDDDGTWWMIWGATEIAPLKPDFTGFAAEPTTIGPSGDARRMGHEGCLLRKMEGKYVLFGTGWSTGQMRKGSYNLYYAIADRPTGPYGARLFVGRFLGHGTPFQDAAGRWWCTAFYNANVPPISGDDVASRDLGDNAHTINEQGVTIVPLDVTVGPDGQPVIRAKDPRYAMPGPDESQQFDLEPRPE